MEKKNEGKKSSKILNKKKEREKTTKNTKLSPDKHKEDSINFYDVETFNIEFKSNPEKNMNYQKMNVDNWDNNNHLLNTLISFKSFDNILYLIYSNNTPSIICHDIINNKKIIEIKKAHKYHISDFKHYLDKKNNRDLLISISDWIYNIKIWNINNWECLYNFKDDTYGDNYTYSADFLIDNNNIFIIIGRSNIFYTEIITPEDEIRVYDLKGEKIKEIKNSNKVTSNISTYYDNQLNKIYIIGADRKFINSYDYYENQLYNKYGCCDDNDPNIDDDENSLYIFNYCSLSIFRINQKKDLVELIYLDQFSNINIWNFHSRELLGKFNLNKILIYDICLWNNEYMFIGCTDNTIKLIELENYKIVKTLNGHNDYVKNINKIIHPKYGECLLSQGILNDEIFLWSPS